MSSTRLVRTLAALGFVLAVVPVSGVLAGPASAAIFNVTTTADSGAGSLRQALADAAVAAGDDVVEIQAGLGTITVSSELAWTGNGAVTINGNGATVAGPGVPRGLVDDGGNGLVVNSLSLTGFGASFLGDAAPIVSQGGSITVNACSISGNAITTDGDVAGGVLSEGGAVAINDCTISGNSALTTDGDAAGGVLSEGGNVVITVSTISGNTADATFGDAGGGVLSEGGSVTVRDSTFNCNVAASSDGDAAGGILSEGADITINGSTVVGNSATGVEFTEGALLAPGNAINGTGNTISDDTAACAAPPPPPPPPGSTPAPTPVQAAARFTG